MSYEPIDDGRTVKARKLHICEWCGEKISKGELCIMRKYVSDGELTNCRMHPECFEAMNRDALSDRDPCGYMFYPHENARGMTQEEHEAMEV